MKTTILSIFLLVFAYSVFAQTIPVDSLYLGQNVTVGNNPKLFKLPVTAKSFAAERIAISDDGKTIYYQELDGYSEMDGKPHTQRIKYFTFVDGKWKGAFVLFEGYGAPALSITGDTMYIQKPSKFGILDAYFSVKKNQGWSTPKRFLTNLVSSHYLQVTNNGNYYISSKPSICIGKLDRCRLFIKNPDTIVTSLGLPLNTVRYNFDFFVSRNDSFMIITDSISHLSISYHKKDGSWTNPKDLGNAINFGLGAWGPYMWKDNKYLFYTTGTKPDYSDCGVYWLNISNLIDSLRHTNFVPYLKLKLTNQSAIVGKSFTYSVPNSTFIDDDGNNTLTFSAFQSNGTPLPFWLQFNAATQTFTGIPSEASVLKIKVTATDNAKVFTSSEFEIQIVK